MNDIRKPSNLVIESFLVLGRCWKQISGSLMLAGLVMLAGWIIDMITPFPPVMIKFLLMIPVFYVSAVLLRVVGKSAAGQPENFYDSCAASRLPSLYLLAFSIMFVVVLVTIAMGARMLDGLLHTKWIGLTIAAVSFLVLSVRMVYACYAITLEEEGPLEAAGHSWQLSSGMQCFTALGIFLAYHILPALVAGTVIAGFKFLIPSFSFSYFSFVGIFAAGLYLIAILAITAFGFLVFLNQDQPVATAQPSEDQLRLEQDLAQALNTATLTERPAAKMPAAPENPPANIPAGIKAEQQAGHMPCISFDDELPQQPEATAGQAEQKGQEDPNGGGIKMSR